jgi:hypothetical protein
VNRIRLLNEIRTELALLQAASESINKDMSLPRGSSPKARRRPMTTEQRERLSESQKKRWAEYNRKKEQNLKLQPEAARAKSCSTGGLVRDA